MGVVGGGGWGVGGVWESSSMGVRTRPCSTCQTVGVTQCFRVFSLVDLSRLESPVIPLRLADRKIVIDIEQQLFYIGLACTLGKDCIIWSISWELTNQTLGKITEHFDFKKTT